MNLIRLDRSDALLVAASGQIDHASADAFLASLQAMLAAAPVRGPLVLDISGVDYISSAGLRALMVVARQAGRMGVTGLQPLVREVFAIARFELIVPCFPDADAAVKALA